VKIAIYAIALNEEKFAERFAESCTDADLILVADTGSADDTADILACCEKTMVTEALISPWRFDDARNAALWALPPDIDVCVSLDLDEVMTPGWREKLEAAWVPGTTRLRYQYNWGAGMTYYYDKIHARKGYRWRHACHECPTPDRITEVMAQTSEVLVAHYPDPHKSRGQYLDLLRICVEEDPFDNQHSFFYGRELSFYGRYDESIAECKRYLELPKATWINERCYACRVIADCYQKKGDWHSCLCWLRRACSEAPYTREPWYDLALACYHTQRWEEALGAMMTCLKIERSEAVYTSNPAVWTATPNDIVAICAWNLGLKDLAREHIIKAVALAPDDPRLQANLKVMAP